MRIVVWNCAMKLAGRKLQALENLQPDVAIVPECACPDRLWGKQPLLAPIPMEWIGDDENKGLGVLAFNGYRVSRHRAYDPALRWLLPVEIQGPIRFHLLAVWGTNQTATTGDASVGQPLPVVERYRKFLAAAPAVVAGDFHHLGGDRSTPTPLVAGLERLGLASAYHVGRGELHGKETLPTLYGPRRSPDGPQRHVDYCFVPLEWCSCLRQVDVGPFDAWVGSGLSRHVPLIVDVDLADRPAAPAPKSKHVRTDLEGLGIRIKRPRKA